MSGKVPGINLQSPLIAAGVVAVFGVFLAGYGVGNISSYAPGPSPGTACSDQCSAFCTNLTSLTLNISGQLHQSTQDLKQDKLQQDKLIYNIYTQIETLNITLNGRISNVNEKLKDMATVNTKKDEHISDMIKSTREKLALIKRITEEKNGENKDEIIQVQKMFAGFQDLFVAHKKTLESSFREDLDGVMNELHKIQTKSQKLEEYLKGVSEKQADIQTQSEIRDKELKASLYFMSKSESGTPPIGTLSSGTEKSGKVTADRTDGLFGYFLITWILNLLLLVMGFAILSTRSQTRASQTSPVQGMDTPMEHQSPVPFVPKGDNRAGPPTVDLSVIAFTESTVDDARAIIRSLKNDLNLDIQEPDYHVLRGHLELVNVPVSKGYLVIIGYDSRDAILEDMDGYQGNKKRETITQLMTSGGKLLVIYMDNDSSSESPPGAALYHPRLLQTENHPVLASIVNDRKFVSIHRGKISGHQTRHLRAWIMSL